MLTPRRGLGSAILEGILYVVGGSDGIAALNQVIFTNFNLPCAKRWQLVHLPIILCAKTKKMLIKMHRKALKP